MTLLTPPEPALTPGQMVERAHAMIPTLRARAEEAEKLRTLPQATFDDFVEAGFFRIMQPRRFGGYEFDLRTFCDVMTAISRGCGSSGWVLTLTSAHTFHMAAFPEEGQIEMYGDDGNFRSPLTVAPQGAATPVDGGYRVNGRWNYNSGGEYSNWLGLSAVVPGESEGADPKDLLMVFIRREDYEIFDNWHVMGMRGTGSKQAILENVFVPHRRAISQPAWLQAQAPGYGVHENPFYQTPPWQVFCAELASIFVGLAEAAIDAFFERAMNKRSPWPPFELVRNERASQRRVGYARAKADAAGAVRDRIVGDQLQRMERVVSGPNFFIDEELRRAELQLQQVFALAQECVQHLFAASGSSAGQTGQLIERVFRDLNMGGTHYMLNADRTTENWGAMFFGLEPYSPN